MEQYGRSQGWTSGERKKVAFHYHMNDALVTAQVSAVAAAFSEAEPQSRIGS
jgi:hypothetical protein